MRRRLQVAMGVLFLVVAAAFAVLSIEAFSKLWVTYRDSPWWIYVEYGALEAVAAIVGAFPPSLGPSAHGDRDRIRRPCATKGCRYLESTIAPKTQLSAAPSRRAGDVMSGALSGI